MVETASKFHMIDEIIIIDNDSTFEPLLDWYEQLPCRVIRENNLGHNALWKSSILDKISIPYIYTDSDLGIDDLPYNIIEILSYKLNESSDLGKIGLKLNYEQISNDSIYFNFLKKIELPRWEKSRIYNGIYIDVHTDTTFAIYNKKNYFVGGGTYPKYVARHYPWEFTYESLKKNDEYMFYLHNSNESSSFKQILKEYEITNGISK